MFSIFGQMHFGSILSHGRSHQKRPGNKITVVLALLFLSLTVYDITKTALYGRNMLNCTETSKKNIGYYSRDYLLDGLVGLKKSVTSWNLK